MVGPALTDVADELRDRGVPAVCDILEDGSVALQVIAEPDETPFRYHVLPERQPVWHVGQRTVAAPREWTTRLEVHLEDGGAGYDVMGYSYAQLVHDILDQYEQHLDFVRLARLEAGGRSVEVTE